MIELLVLLGANITVKTDGGRSSLMHLAAQNKNAFGLAYFKDNFLFSVLEIDASR
jgi:hypothetical protein